MSLARSAFIAALSLTALAGTAAGASAQTYGASHQAQHCQVQASGHQGHRHKGRFAKERAQIRKELSEGKISKEQAHAELRQIRVERK